MISMFAYDILVWKFVCQSSKLFPQSDLLIGSFVMSLVSSMYKILSLLLILGLVLVAVCGVIGTGLTELFWIMLVEFVLIGVKVGLWGAVELSPQFSKIVMVSNSGVTSWIPPNGKYMTSTFASVH